LLELREGRKVSVRKDVARRLVQGIGRIGRIATGSGVCVTFFDPNRFPISANELAVRKVNRKELLRELQQWLKAS